MKKENVKKSAKKSAKALKLEELKRLMGGSGACGVYQSLKPKPTQY